MTTRHLVSDAGIDQRATRGRDRHRDRAVTGGEGLSGTDLKALKTKTADAINAELQLAGYPKAPTRRIRT